MTDSAPEPPTSAEWRDDPWPPPPDAVDLVREASDLMAVFSAHRFVRLDALRREQLDDAARAGRELTDVVERGIRLEVAAALRITELAADRLLTTAEALVHRYPAVLESLEAARITERHAELLVESLDQLGERLSDDTITRALGVAEVESVGTLRRSLRRLVDEVREAALAERHEEALRRRRVIVEPAADGMAWLMALMPAVEAHAAYGRITAMAKVLAGREGEERTFDQLRADVIGDLLIEGEASSHPAEARGIRATVAVTVPVLALLDGPDTRFTEVEGSASTSGIRRVEGSASTSGIRWIEGSAPSFEMPRVEGVGPISIAQAEALCGGADGWMRILTHPETGAVLSVGRDLYRPPPALRRLVRWRADRCMAPGCGMPAGRCEIDHTVAWETGGTTELSNLAPICKGHHLVKHHGGWQVRQVEGSGGALEWTSPTGRRYTVAPERRVPVFVTADDSAAPF